MSEYATIGAPIYFSSYKISDNLIINVYITDTAGQERFKEINLRHYKNADSIILLYDITNKYSFDECKNYFCKKIKENCKNNIKVILIGNKKDLEDERKVSFKEANDFAVVNNYIHMETSCLRNENVFETFKKAIEITLMEKKKETEKEKKNEIINENKKENKNENKSDNNTCLIN